jgi:hypothetical protein
VSSSNSSAGCWTNSIVAKQRFVQLCLIERQFFVSGLTGKLPDRK